jgi:hypothetical protein
MPLSRFLAALCRVLGSRLKPIATPLQNLISPKLDPREDRCLIASNILAIGSSAGVPPLVKLLDID